MNFLTQNESTSAAIASIADERIKAPARIDALREARAMWRTSDSA
jgi:hypothetical protein